MLIRRSAMAEDLCRERCSLCRTPLPVSPSSVRIRCRCAPSTDHEEPDSPDHEHAGFGAGLAWSSRQGSIAFLDRFECRFPTLSALIAMSAKHSAFSHQGFERAIADGYHACSPALQAWLIFNLGTLSSHNASLILFTRLPRKRKFSIGRQPARLQRLAGDLMNPKQYFVAMPLCSGAAAV